MDYQEFRTALATVSRPGIAGPDAFKARNIKKSLAVAHAASIMGFLVIIVTAVLSFLAVWTSEDVVVAPLFFAGSRAVLLSFFPFFAARAYLFHLHRVYQDVQVDVTVESKDVEFVESFKDC